MYVGRYAYMSLCGRRTGSYIYIYTYFYNIPIFVILKTWCFIPSHSSIRHSAASVALHGRQHEALHDGRHRGTSQDQFRKVGARSVLQLDRLAKNFSVFQSEELKYCLKKTKRSVGVDLNVDRWCEFWKKGTRMNQVIFGVGGQSASG